MTTSGRPNRPSDRRALTQVRLVSSMLTVRAVRRVAGEAGLGSVDRRWLVAVVAALGLLAALGVGLVGVLAAQLTSVGTGSAATTYLGVLAVAAVAAPWLVGSLGVATAAATHVDPSHTLFRPAMVSELVPVLARMGIPALLRAVATALTLAALAGPTLRARGVPGGVVAALCGDVLLYAVAVTGARLLLLGLRLQGVASLRRGRLGLPLIVATVVAQAAAAFAAPHVMTRVAPDPDLGSALASAGRATVSLGAPTLAVAGGVLALAATALAPLSLRALDRGLHRIESELRHASARVGLAAAAAPPLPVDPLAALVSKDVRRARRAAGPLMGPAVATTAWGCVLACGLLGLITSGLLPGSDNPLTLGFQLLVAALVAIEFASAGLKPITSPDADGYAARALVAVPGGALLSARAKATLHARSLSAVAVVTLGTLVLAVDTSLGGVLALVCLLVGGVVLSTLEHVGAPAVHPRLDWTTIEQIGGNPRAQTLGLTLSVGGFVLLNTLATSLATIDAGLPLRTLVLAALVGAAALLSPRLARGATTVLIRRLT